MKPIYSRSVCSAPFLSQATTAHGFLFVSGQINLDVNGKLVGDSVTTQFAQIMSNVTAILNAAQATLSNVVKATIYVTDLADAPKINELWLTYFSQPMPAREMVQVAALPLGATIEVSVIAKI
ncbi:MAG: RidA family protein [Candidatus Saccharimonadales bacterium]